MKTLLTLSLIVALFALAVWGLDLRSAALFFAGSLSGSAACLVFYPELSRHQAPKAAVETLRPREAQL